MNTPTRDDLLGFVLGALEAEEHQRVADCLQAHPDLQLELQRILAQLAPLEWCQQPPADFPVGLARRTCEIVSRESRQPACQVLREPGCAASTTGQDQPLPATPVGTQFSRARRTRSAVMVCCAAVLGAALGPTAMRFTQAVINAPVSNGAIAAHRSKSTRPTYIFAPKSTSKMNTMDIYAFQEGNAATLPSSESRFGSPLQQIEFASEPQPNGRANGPAAIPLATSYISFCSQSSGPSTVTESDLWEHPSDVRNGWRPLSDDSNDESRASDMTDSLSQIGSRSLISTYSRDAFHFDVQPISN